MLSVAQQRRFDALPPCPASLHPTLLLPHSKRTQSRGPSRMRRWSGVRRELRKFIRHHRGLVSAARHTVLSHFPSPPGSCCHRTEMSSVRCLVAVSDRSIQRAASLCCYNREHGLSLAAIKPVIKGKRVNLRGPEVSGDRITTFCTE